MMWGDSHATHEPDGFVCTKVNSYTLSDNNDGRGDDILTEKEGRRGNDAHSADICMHDPILSGNDWTRLSFNSDGPRTADPRQRRGLRKEWPPGLSKSDVISFRTPLKIGRTGILPAAVNRTGWKPMLPILIFRGRL